MESFWACQGHGLGVITKQLICILQKSGEFLTGPFRLLIRSWICLSAVDVEAIFFFLHRFRNSCWCFLLVQWCWRALRIQKKLSNKVVESPESSPSSKREWVENLWSFDTGEEDDDIDLEELGRALSEAASLTSTKKKQNVTNSKKKSPSTGQSTRSIDGTIPVLPCFYTYTQEEKLSKKATSESSQLQISIHEYEENHEDGSDGENYREENYEYDSSLHADRTYLKFKKRMDVYPQQCFRYSYGGKPLLASSKMMNPGSCKLCDGARHFEMQLMPTLIYFLQERADDQQRMSLEKSDWSTMLIYTCSTNCAGATSQIKSGDGDWIVAEESVILQH